MKLTTRIMIAIAIAVMLYGVSLGIGSVLYATGVIATGATHADCGRDPRDVVADNNPGIDRADLPQSEIKAEAQRCLTLNELTEDEAFRVEYLTWPIWPAAICAVIFLLWPVWSRILHDQEVSEDIASEHPAHS